MEHEYTDSGVIATDLEHPVLVGYFLYGVFSEVYTSDEISYPSFILMAQSNLGDFAGVAHPRVEDARGVQAITTYPAIYKEYTTSNGTYPVVPRVYPPILIDRKRYRLIKR